MSTQNQKEIGSKEVAENIKDIALAMALLVVGLGSFWAVNPSQTPRTPGSGGLDFASFPLAAASILICLTLIYVARPLISLWRGNYRSIQCSAVLSNFNVGRTLMLRRVLTVSLLVAYAASLGTVPFIAATSIFLFSGFALFGRSQIMPMILLSIGGAGVANFLFITVLKLPL